MALTTQKAHFHCLSHESRSTLQHLTQHHLEHTRYVFCVSKQQPLHSFFFGLSCRWNGSWRALDRASCLRRQEMALAPTRCTRPIPTRPSIWTARGNLISSMVDPVASQEMIPHYVQFIRRPNRACTSKRASGIELDSYHCCIVLEIPYILSLKTTK